MVLNNIIMHVPVYAWHCDHRKATLYVPAIINFQIPLDSKVNIEGTLSIVLATTT